MIILLWVLFLCNRHVALGSGSQHYPFRALGGVGVRYPFLPVRTRQPCALANTFKLPFETFFFALRVYHVG